MKAGYQECPVCAEEIRLNAKMCRFCGAVLNAGASLPRIISLRPAEAACGKDRPAPCGPEEVSEAEGEPPSWKGKERYRRKRGAVPPRPPIPRALRSLVKAHYAGTDASCAEKQARRLEEFLSHSPETHRQASVLFAGLQGGGRSTPAAKKALEGFYEICTQAVEFHTGFIVKYGAKGVAAVFGAPVAYDRDAESAVRSALAIIEQVRSLPSKAKSGWSASAGIATGGIRSSTALRGKKPSFDVFGASVHLAACLQETARANTVLICPGTKDLVNGVFELRRQRPRVFKNQSKPLAVWKVTGEKVPGILRRDFSMRFVGRERELEKLEGIWTAFDRGCSEQRADGRFEGVRIAGAPGIGKSRLVDEFLKRRSEAGRILFSENSPHETHVPYSVWKNLLQPLWEKRAGEPGETARRGFERFLGEQGFEKKAMPGLRAMFGFPGAMDQAALLGPAVLRSHLLSDLAVLLERLAEKKPLILVMDDLQWADRSSLEIVEALAAPPGLWRVFLIAVYRPGLSAPVSCLESLPSLKLRVLDEEHRAMLLHDLAPVRDLSPEVLDMLGRQTAGNPLFLVETIRNVVDQLDQLDAPLEGEALARRVSEWVPNSLKSLIQSRIDLLNERQQIVLQCSAVLGQRFSHDLIHLFGMVREELLQRLYALRGLEFLDSVHSSLDIEFLFRHHLVREISYQSLLKKQRQEFHRIIAGKMEDVYRNRLDELYPVLAYHYQKADEHEQAIHYLHLAGDRAAAQAATSEAVSFYESALQRLMENDSSRENHHRAGRILKSKGRLHRISGQNDLALESFETGRRLVSGPDNREAMAEFSVEAGLTYLQMSEYEKAAHEIEGALAATSNAELRAMALNALGYCRWGVGDFAQARRHYEKALALAEKTQNQGVEDDARNNLALLDWKEGRLEDALENMRASLRLSQKSQNRFGIGLKLMNIGILEEQMGRLATARRRYQEALDMAERIRFPQLQAAVCGNLANLCLIEQNHGEALQHAARSRELAEMIGDRRSAAIALENLTLGHIGLGQFSAARETLRKARKIAEAVDDQERKISLEMVEIELLLESAQQEKTPFDAPEAEKHLQRIQERIEKLQLRSEQPRLWRLFAQVYRQANAKEKMRTALDKAMAECRAQKMFAEKKRIDALRR